MLKGHIKLKNQQLNLHLPLLLQKDIFSGDVINEKNCTFKRPGDGGFLQETIKNYLEKKQKENYN